MFQIRHEQMEPFREEAAKRFEDRMVSFLKEHFPDQSGKLGDTKVRQLIQYGVSRANRYGMTGQRDVCQYLGLMFMFGGNFDEDSRLSELREALLNPRLTPPGAKIEAVYCAATRELERRSKRGL